MLLRYQDSFLYPIPAVKGETNMPVYQLTQTICIRHIYLYLISVEEPCNHAFKLKVEVSRDAAKTIICNCSMSIKENTLKNTRCYSIRSYARSSGAKLLKIGKDYFFQ
jgi:hypothetical protein